ncbi:MAG: transporter substrate-binding protein [Naasia sp.]|nr:transporter substrate-binding protein [Naasia sp.]
MKYSAAFVTAAALLLSGCAGVGGPNSTDGILNVVASTDVWGDIAIAVGGERILVTSIIDSPDQDPHEYEASARDRLAVSRADLVIVNGGGYDPFMSSLLDASEGGAPVVSAIELSGLLADARDADGHAAEQHAAEEHGDHQRHVEGVNEHVWYSIETAEAVANEVAARLAQIDPGGEADYTSGLTEFLAGIGELEARVEALHPTLEGRAALLTEPVPAALLSALGLTDATPPQFAESVEEDTDVPAAVLRDMLDRVGSGEPALLAYNLQASTAQTELVRQAAEDAGLPVVDFAETLPEGTDYLGWMGDNITAVEEAVAP